LLEALRKTQKWQSMFPINPGECCPEFKADMAFIHDALESAT